MVVAPGLTYLSFLSKCMVHNQEGGISGRFSRWHVRCERTIFATITLMTKEQDARLMKDPSPYKSWQLYP
jgi:hypothetical protein